MGVATEGRCTMANLNVTYDELRTAGNQLITGKGDLENRLMELKSYIDNLVSEGYVTSSSSGAFQEQYHAVHAVRHHGDLRARRAEQVPEVGRRRLAADRRVARELDPRPVAVRWVRAGGAPAAAGSEGVGSARTRAVFRCDEGDGCPQFCGSLGPDSRALLMRRSCAIWVGWRYTLIPPWATREAGLPCV